MKSITSYFNKGILKNDLKRNGWLSTFYTIALFFVMPFKLLQLQNAPYFTFNSGNLKRIIYFDTGGEAIVVIPISIIAGMLIFRYLHKKISTDALHSLPIKRSVLYNTHILSGIIILVIPLIINAIIFILLSKILPHNIDSYYKLTDLLISTGSIIILEIPIYLITVLVGITVGMSSVQGVLSVIILFLPLGLFPLIESNINYFVYGLKWSANVSIQYLSPALRLIYGFYWKSALSIFEIFFYIALIIIIYILSQYLYKKRRLEATNQTINFSGLESVFKYCVTAFCMLLVGLYFKETCNNSLSWVISGYLLGSFAGYFISEMIIKKTIWVFKSFKGYIIYLGIILILLCSVNYNIFGYEDKTPEVNNIRKAYFCTGYYFNNSMLGNDFSSKEDIKIISRLHKYIIEHKKEYKHIDRGPVINYSFIYILKDGTKLKRYYSLPNYYDKQLYDGTIEQHWTYPSGKNMKALVDKLQESFNKRNQ